VRRRAQRRSEDAQQDRAHGEVLTPTRPLPQHPLADQQQHEQAGRHRGLHHHQRREREGQQLQRPSEHREAGAEQPAPAFDEVAREPQAQIFVLRGLSGVQRLQRNP
jgi:hypothetical protein